MTTANQNPGEGIIISNIGIADNTTGLVEVSFLQALIESGFAHECLKNIKNILEANLYFLAKKKRHQPRPLIAYFSIIAPRIIDDAPTAYVIWTRSEYSRITVECAEYMMRRAIIEGICGPTHDRFDPDNIHVVIHQRSAAMKASAASLAATPSSALQ